MTTSPSSVVATLAWLQRSRPRGSLLEAAWHKPSPRLLETLEMVAEELRELEGERERLNLLARCAGAGCAAMSAAVRLRPYQLEAVDRLRDALRRHRRVVFQLPTGGGKTIIFGAIASGVQGRGKRALVLVHRRELIRQTVEKLANFGVQAGVIAAGWPANPARQIQVASVQTLARRLEQVPAADLVVVDEAHHAVAGAWSAVLAHYRDTLLLGVTTTPERLDGKGLAGQFGELICGPSVAELTEAGYLAEAKLLSAPRMPDLSSVRRVAGDFAAGQLAEIMSDRILIGDAVHHYRDHADGVPVIAFCVTVAHAEMVAERFRAAGYRAASVDGAMATRERDAIIGGLATGALQIVTSCALISEGLDIPDVGAAILLRPTKSLALFLQQVGRALRPKPDGAPAWILDHAGNARRHSYPADPKLWSLEGRKARERAEAAAAERERQERQQASSSSQSTRGGSSLAPGHIDAGPAGQDAPERRPRAVPDRG